MALILQQYGDDKAVIERKSLVGSFLLAESNNQIYISEVPGKFKFSGLFKSVRTYLKNRALIFADQDDGLPRWTFGCAAP